VNASAHGAVHWMACRDEAVRMRLVAEGMVTTSQFDALQVYMVDLDPWAHSACLQMAHS
jgi:hypothetical protein